MIRFFKKFMLLVVLLNGLQTPCFTQDGYQRAHLWEKEIKSFADQDKKGFPRKNVILFVGSSSIRGWRTLNKDFPDFHTINRGFGGSHLEDINFYFEQVVFPYKPKLIVLYAGENDLVAGKSIKTVFNDFKKFVSMVHQRMPKTRLIFISLKPSPARWEFSSKFKELNSLIKMETEKDKRLLFADVWLSMLDAEGLPKRGIFLGDKLHLNPEGYKIWREILLPQIKLGLKVSF